MNKPRKLPIDPGRSGNTLSDDSFDFGDRIQQRPRPVRGFHGTDEANSRRGSIGSRVVAWWDADFDYEWMPRFLAERGLTKLLQWSIAAWCAAFGTYIALLQFTVGDSGDRWRSALLIILAASSFYAAVRWPTTVWPTERRSIWFVVWADAVLGIGIVFGSGATASPLAASGLFIVIGIYVAMLHSSRTLSAHISWVCVAVGAAALRQVALEPETEDAILAIRVFFLLGLTIGVPVVAHIGLQTLKDAAARSQRDPLTGLLNRWGLAAAAQRLLSSTRDGSDVIVTMLTDLDRFKSLNDRHGHTGGDRALRAVATRLTAAVPATGFVARLGGDEFATVVAVPHNAVANVVTEVHASVYDSRDAVPVCASTGAWIWLDTKPVTDPAGAFSAQLHRADLAMYDAKRAGGNRLVFHSSTDAMQ